MALVELYQKSPFWFGVFLDSEPKRAFLRLSSILQFISITILVTEISKGVPESCIQVRLFYFTKKEGILKEATQNSKK